MATKHETRQHRRELACVRELAHRYAEVANSPEQEAIRQRWRNTYMLRPADRVPIWLRPDAECWLELVPSDVLDCQTPWLRRLEHQLRIALRHHEFGDDAVMLPYWSVDAAIEHEGEYLWGVPIRRRYSDVVRGAWAYDPAIETPDDLHRLRQPSWTHNSAETDRRLNRFGDVLDGILPVRLRALPPILPGVGRNATDLIGPGSLLLNMALNPDFIHKLMTFIRDSILKCLDQVGAMGILTENNDEPIHFSESLKTSPSNVPVRLSDLWLRTESQQFQGVSPAMWREFCLEYQKPIMQRFRYVSYGCCEDLTDRIDEVLAISNLRIFVNSPWTDLQTAAAKCGDRYSIVWRQMASEVIFASDLTPARTRLEEGMVITRGCHRAIVLQEIATAGGNQQRLQDWVRMAKDVSERFS